MSLLRSLRPVRREFRRNAYKHRVLSRLLRQAHSILTRRCVVLAPWLRFYSLLSHDGASFTLPLPRALTNFLCHRHRRLVQKLTCTEYFVNCLFSRQLLVYTYIA